MCVDLIFTFPYCPDAKTNQPEIGKSQCQLPQKVMGRHDRQSSLWCISRRFISAIQFIPAHRNFIGRAFGTSTRLSLRQNASPKHPHLSQSRPFPRWDWERIIPQRWWLHEHVFSDWRRGTCIAVFSCQSSKKKHKDSKTCIFSPAILWSASRPF